VVADNSNALKLTLYKPLDKPDNMWSECRNNGTSEKLLMSQGEKELVFYKCFKNLPFIFCNIFHILTENTFPSTASTDCLTGIDVINITKPVSGLAPGGVSNTSTDTYLEYKVPNLANYKTNLSYYDTDNKVKFNGIINVNDLLKRTDTHRSVHSSRSPPLGYSRIPPLRYSISPPIERIPSPPRVPRERIPSPPRVPRERRISPPRVPRERIPSPPRVPRERRISPPRERIPSPPLGYSRSPSRLPRIPSPPIEQREQIRHMRVMPIEAHNVTRREKRNAEPHAETPFWGRVGRRRG
jgi:hypothetical protein